MQKKVSVVIPAYNADGTILETLKSARAQTFVLHEILVIDDRSTDKTASIVQQFAGACDNVRLISKDQNEGLSAARNTGIAAATGDWIALLDADDLWAPNKIESQLEFAEAHPDLSLIGAYYRELYSSGVGPLRAEFFWPSACIIKRSVAVELLFGHEWRASEFPEFLSRFDEKYKRGGVPTALMQYRVTSTGIAHQKFFQERKAWKLINENTRRRQMGEPEVPYKELDSWYVAATSRFERLRNSLRWRGDYYLRCALMDIREGRQLRGVIYGILGTFLNPVSIVKKRARMSGLFRQEAPDVICSSSNRTSD